MRAIGSSDGAGSCGRLGPAGLAFPRPMLANRPDAAPEPLLREVRSSPRVTCAGRPDVVVMRDVAIRLCP